MGLDMYLTRRIFIGAEYEHRKITGSIQLFEDGKLMHIDVRKVSEIYESVGYWRKANHIHAWLVGNIQSSVDDCKDYYFNCDKIKELYDICNKVLIDRGLAEELLPCVSGFFFGGSQYDEWYFSDIKDTVGILKPLLNSHEIYYNSSW